MRTQGPDTERRETVKAPTGLFPTSEECAGQRYGPYPEFRRVVQRFYRPVIVYDYGT